jgi:hypothetical protein
MDIYQNGVLIDTATVLDFKDTGTLQFDTGYAQPGGGTVNIPIKLNLGSANTWTADQSVPDEAYGVGWNGSMEVPTKNALYDKIETIVGGTDSGFAPVFMMMGA